MAANLPRVSTTTPAANFATSLASLVYTDGKFAAEIVDTGVNDTKAICHRYQNTGGKFATGVNDTRGK